MTTNTLVKQSSILYQQGKESRPLDLSVKSGFLSANADAPYVANATLTSFSDLCKMSILKSALSQELALIVHFFRLLLTPPEHRSRYVF